MYVSTRASRNVRVGMHVPFLLLPLFCAVVVPFFAVKVLVDLARLIVRACKR